MNAIKIGVTILLWMSSQNIFSAHISTFHQLDGVIEEGLLKIDDYDDLLIVIDMQPNYFVTAEPLLQSNIMENIRKSKEKGDLIVFMQDCTIYPTYALFVDKTNDYLGRRCKLIKQQPSGAICLKKWMNKHNISHLRNIRACGFATGCCVLWTVLDLCKEDNIGSITVVANSCVDSNNEQHLAALEKLSQKTTKFNKLHIEH